MKAPGGGEVRSFSVALRTRVCYFVPCRFYTV